MNPGLRAAVLSAALASAPLCAQRLTFSRQATTARASLRGLSVVSDQVAWASGSGGTVLRTVDGGATWSALPIPGAERQDFRDVKAFSDKVAYALAIAGNGGLYKTSDGGASWTRQYASTEPGFFLDSMAFRDARHGTAVGDPMGGIFLVLDTVDGIAWKPDGTVPPALAGEGAFAASGSAIAVRGVQVWIATGGAATARVYHRSCPTCAWSVADAPMGGRGSGSGIFSIAMCDGRHAAAVGGDYTHPESTARSAAWSNDGGATWNAAAAMPAGYRSSVACNPSNRKLLLAAGPTGTDLSSDGGAHWLADAKENLNTIAWSGKNGGWAVGPRGAIYRFTLR